MISEVAKRYAKALFELCQENKTQDKVFAELRQVNQALGADPQLALQLGSPLISPDQKANAVRVAFNGKVSAELFSTLVLLAEKDRLSLLADLGLAYEAISDSSHGVTRGTVRSASPLSADAQKKLEETVSKVTGKKVILSFVEDKTIMGGMVAQVGGWTFDDSLATHLTRLSEDLNRRTH